MVHRTMQPDRREEAHRPAGGSNGRKEAHRRHLDQVRRHPARRIAVLPVIEETIAQLAPKPAASRLRCMVYHARHARTSKP